MMITVAGKRTLQLVAVICLGVVGGGVAVSRGAADEPAARDALVYRDGDRVQGKFVRSEGDVIVFKADRFGELRVGAGEAVVIMAEISVDLPKPADAVVTGQPPTETQVKAAADREEVERLKIWEWFSPWVLTAKVRNYFGPWHGRFAFSTELVSDAARHSNFAVDGHMQRKWKSDEVQVNMRHDYAKANNLVTTDVIKAAGSYRHDFPKGRFALYRPTLEWNSASKRGGVPNDYVLLQQEVGGGFNVLVRPSRKIRAGISENFFDVWNSAPTADHTSRAVASVFEEMELILPWRMSVAQRGVWYIPIGMQADGWENRIELNKKLTETLSVAVRHEIRRNSPDGAAQDYTRLKLLLGLDF
ncbi:MAG: hypothetical protein ABIO94_08865 [Opitutaceae bacterium]